MRGRRHGDRRGKGGRKEVGRWGRGAEKNRKGKKVKNRECLSPDEEVPSKTVILGFLWGTE